MKKKLISQILSGALSVEELDDSSIGGEPNATVDDSKIPAAGTDSTANGTEATPAEIPATDPKPEDDVDGDATQTAAVDGDEATQPDPAAEEPVATEPAVDETGATEPGTEEPPVDTTATTDVDEAGNEAGTQEPPVDDPAVAGDATAAATDGGTEDASEPQAAEEPPVDDPSIASLGDEAGASGPAAGETGDLGEGGEAEPELDENGEPVKKEPSPDAEVTPLPEGVDPESVDESSNIDESTIEEDEEEIEESEEDIVAKADAVADLTNAQTSLEELVAEIESTIQDGGLTPEGVIAAQGAANDILNEVNEEPIGLPSQESFATFEGRRSNTIIAMEGIGDKIKAVGSRIWETVVSLLRNVMQRLIGDKARLTRTTKFLQAWFKDPRAAQKFELSGDPVTVPTALCQRLKLLKPTLDYRSVQTIATVVASCAGYTTGCAQVIDNIATGASDEIQRNVENLKNSVGVVGSGLVNPTASEGFVESAKLTVRNSIDSRSFVNSSILLIDKTLHDFDKLTIETKKALNAAEKKVKAPEGGATAASQALTEVIGLFRLLASYTVTAPVVIGQIATELAKKTAAAAPKAAA